MATTYLIDSTFFVSEISVPNTGKADVLENLNNLIHKHETECLKQILGYELFNKFENALPTPVEQRMSDLLNGVEWTSPDGTIQKWQGLVHDKLSLIANYIYWFYKKNEATQSSGIGTVVPKGASVVNVSPREKMTSAWNFFSEESIDLIYFLRNQKDAGGNIMYPEFTDKQYLIAYNFCRKVSTFDL